MAINKIVYGDQTLIDLTADTVEASTLLVGATAHDKSGAVINGACSFDSNTQDATASVSEILNTKTAYVRGAKVTGNMPNIGKQASTTISAKAGTVTIAQGYHDGSAKVSISTTEQAKIIAGNIKNGVTILGVQGNYTGESTEIPQSKTVDAPLSEDLTVTPSSGYTCLSQVIVRKVPYVTAGNSAGGTTVTIG